MPQNFNTTINFDGRDLLAIILPAVRKDGMYYEINITGYPRFFMKWSALDRYDIVGGEDAKVPYALLITVSDAIEQAMGGRR